MSSNSDTINGIRIFLVVFILLISVFTRFYREDVTKFFTVGTANGAAEFSKFSDEEGNREVQMRRED